MRTCRTCLQEQPLTEYKTAHKICKTCGFIRNMVSQAKYRSKKFDIPFDLYPEDLFIPSHCPLLGIPIEIRSGSRDSTPSLDRIAPDLGYVRGNCWIISSLANTAKNNLTLEQFSIIAENWKFNEAHGYSKKLHKEHPHFQKISQVNEGQ